MRLISVIKQSLLIFVGVLLFSQLILGTHSFLSDDRVGGAAVLVDDFAAGIANNVLLLWC
jgi:hypothetical protein